MTLSVLVVGCGRDGTTSITRILEETFRRNGRRDVRAIHECDNAEIYAAAREYLMRSNPAPARGIIERWGQDVESGNGYAFILPVFREVFGSDLKIVHLRRDRASNVRSMLNHTSWNPAHWGGYLEHEGTFEIVRPNAVDLGEMTAKAWWGSSLEVRLGWYYDRTHAAVETHRALFDHVFDISTDELNDPESLSRLGSFVSPSWTQAAPPSHLNANLDYDFAAMGSTERRKARKMWRQFDFQRAIEDPEYGLRHFARLALARETDAETFFSLPFRRVREIIAETEREARGAAKLTVVTRAMRSIRYRLLGR